MGYLILQIAVVGFAAEEILERLEESFVEMEVARFRLFLQNVADDAAQDLHRCFGY